jgi:hypothetical protein
MKTLTKNEQAILSESNARLKRFKQRTLEESLVAQAAYKLRFASASAAKKQCMQAHAKAAQLLCAARESIIKRIERKQRSSK